jgi:two-component system chemotaxis response regulator CheY
MRMVIRRALTDVGHQVVGEAANGKEAVELYCKYHPDITTMDITMPEMNGLEAVKRIHEKDCLARIIMVTAIGQKSVVTEALREGATDFIVKPFEPEQFIKLVNKTLEHDRQ